MVFNMVMDTKHHDRQIIQDLGGPTKVAELLGFDKRAGGAQRVQNWLVRGIPAEVKLARPDLFAPELVERIKQEATH